MLSASQYTALQSISNCPGPQGIQGIQGIEGPPGPPGGNGTNGTHGAKGDTGDTGPGSEISNTFSVRTLTESPWFEWSISGTNEWTSTDVPVINTTGFTSLNTTDTELRGLLFNGSVWVCSVFVKTGSTSNFPQFLHSSNGKNWTASASSPFGSSGIRGAYDIAWNEDILVAVGTSANISVAYSRNNGITWVPVANSRTNVIEFGRGIAWNGNAFVLTGTPATSSPTASVSFSLNGIGWTPIVNTHGLSGDGQSIATDGKRFVVGGTNNRPIYTTDVYSWASVTNVQWNITNIDSMRIVGLGWNGRQWLLVVDNNVTGGDTVATSTDGINWTTRLNQAQFSRPQSLTWNSYAWVITGTEGTPAVPRQTTLFSTNDAITWATAGTIKHSTSIASRTITGSYYSVVPYINVRDFGAIGDGIVNDENAFKYALNYASQYTRGARVIVPAGTYLCGTSLEIPANLEFVQETGARIVNTSEGQTQIEYKSGASRCRIVKNDDEKNELSSYNGVVMTGIYETGPGTSGLGGDNGTASANTFDIRKDRRYVGSSVPIQTVLASSSGLAVVNSEGESPGAAIGNIIQLNSNYAGLTSGTTYYVVTVELFGTGQRLTLSTTADLLSSVTIGTSSLSVDGTLYFSNGMGVTLAGRTLLNTANESAGGRSGVEGRFQQTAQTIRNNQNTEYIGVAGYSSSSSGDGGIELTSSNSKGQYFGGKFNSSLTSSATNVRNVIGGQFEVNVPNSTSSRNVFGVSSVGTIGSGITPTSHAAYQIGATNGTSGWRTGILFSSENGGAPLKTTSSVLRSDWVGTVTNGIDLSQLEMTGNVLATPRLQIRDISTDTTPVIRSVTDNEGLTVTSNGTGALNLLSPSGNINIGNSTSNYIQATTSNIKLNPSGTSIATFDTTSGMTLESGSSITINNAEPSYGSTNITSNAIFLGTDSTSDSIAKIGIDSRYTGTNANIQITPKGAGTISLDGDTFVESNNQFRTGTGLVYLNGDTTVAAGKNLTMTSGTGIFSTGTGTVSLNGNTTITGSRTFSTGTGAVTLNGNTTVTGTGTFSTGTGTVSLNGDTTVAAGKNLTMTSGTGTFSTGTGTVSLNGDTTVTAGKNLTMTSGTGTFSTGTGAVSLNGNTTVTGTGTFSTGTGTVSLNGNTTITGIRSFTTGTGDITLNGDTTVAAGKDLSVGNLKVTNIQNTGSVNRISIGTSDITNRIGNTSGQYTLQTDGGTVLLSANTASGTKEIILRNQNGGNIRIQNSGQIDRINVGDSSVTIAAPTVSITGGTTTSLTAPAVSITSGTVGALLLGIGGSVDLPVASLTNGQLQFSGTQSTGDVTSALRIAYRAGNSTRYAMLPLYTNAGVSILPVVYHYTTSGGTASASITLLPGIAVPCGSGTIAPPSINITASVGVTVPGKTRFSYSLDSGSNYTDISNVTELPDYEPLTTFNITNSAHRYSIIAI